MSCKKTRHKVFMYRDEFGRIITDTVDEAIERMGEVYRKEGKHTFWPDEALRDYQIRFNAWKEIVTY
jgi:hypothetical protein